VIGGVAPVGHLNPIRAWFDPRLLDFDVVWAAAGTPRHIFPVNPRDLLRLSGAVEADFTA
jgi:prolyl-tRNA editing enzyme YbaK/EbsC (Cys-tRNA(Pro) deacylase)